jgi:hypothetical protein
LWHGWNCPITFRSRGISEVTINEPDAAVAAHIHKSIMKSKFPSVLTRNSARMCAFFSAGERALPGLRRGND